MNFATYARIDLKGLKAAYDNGSHVKVFSHHGGWSAECNAGLLLDSGVDQFQALEPLVTALKDAGVTRITLEP